MSHNQEAYIGACLDSVLSQRYSGWLEVVVCDDASTDGSYDIITRKAAAYQGSIRIITHRSPVNKRVAANMNTAVALAHGDWLMRVDGDDILHPDRARLTALAISRFPEAAAISGKLIPFTDVPAPVENAPDDELEFRAVDRRDYSENTFPERLEWWGGMMTLSRRLFDTFGDMPASCAVLDDTMFAARALMLGQFVVVTNGVMLYYRRHTGNISPGQKKGRSPFAAMKADAATRDYYRRGLICHEPIMAELEAYAADHPDCIPLRDFFRARFTELKRQALFWEKPWKDRIADARISGSFWRKIPRALRVSCPLLYALFGCLKQR